MWFTETPWPPVWIGVLAAVGFFLAWQSQRRTAFLAAAIGCLAACGLVFVVEAAVVTEAERVEQRVRDLVDAVVVGDADAVLGFFGDSPAVTVFRERVAGAVLRYDVRDDLRVTDLSVELSADGKTAKSHFRANGTVSQLPAGFDWTGPTRWLLTWRREGDGPWRVSAVEQLNPVNGDQVAPQF